MDENELEIFVTYSFDVSIVRLIGNVFLPTTFSVNSAIEKGSDDAEEGEIEAALNRCKHWFDHVVSKCIAFDCENEVAYQMLIDDDGCNRSQNLFFLTPGEPSDEMVATLFQAKMNALGQGAIHVGSIDVKSDNLPGLSFTLHGNHEATLPQTMDDWVGEETFFDTPWWNRADASTLDIIPPAGTDLTEKPSWAYSLDFIGRPSRTTIAGNADVKGFSPTVIKGDKDK